jgi:hypothetical protein
MKPLPPATSIFRGRGGGRGGGRGASCLLVNSHLDYFLFYHV